MDLYQTIDGYCERLAMTFWAEPLNALTNLAFIVAGLMALRLAARQGRVDGPVIFLSANAMVVGVGSFLFHTYATVWAVIADTGPILVFILAYFTIAMNRFAGMRWPAAVAVTLGFLIGMVAVSSLLRVTIGHLVGGSQSYFPALLALVGIGWWLKAKRHPAGPEVMQAGAIFAVSLTFRTLDEPLCAVWPHGTHFLWHLLNGFVLWWLMRALVRHGTAPASRDAAA